MKENFLSTTRFYKIGRVYSLGPTGVHNREFSTPEILSTSSGALSSLDPEVFFMTVLFEVRSGCGRRVIEVITQSKGGSEDRKRKRTKYEVPKSVNYVIYLDLCGRWYGDGVCDSKP